MRQPSEQNGIMNSAGYSTQAGATALGLRGSYFKQE
jgi:hypothetical protein